jgi:hypothetical protein
MSKKKERTTKLLQILNTFYELTKEDGTMHVSAANTNLVKMHVEGMLRDEGFMSLPCKGDTK